VRDQRTALAALIKGFVTAATSAGWQSPAARPAPRHTTVSSAKSCSSACAASASSY